MNKVSHCTQHTTHTMLVSQEWNISTAYQKLWFTPRHNEPIICVHRSIVLPRGFLGSQRILSFTASQHQIVSILIIPNVIVGGSGVCLRPLSSCAADHPGWDGQTREGRHQPGSSGHLGSILGMLCARKCGRIVCKCSCSICHGACD